MELLIRALVAYDTAQQKRNTSNEDSEPVPSKPKVFHSLRGSLLEKIRHNQKPDAELWDFWDQHLPSLGAVSQVLP